MGAARPDCHTIFHPHGRLAVDGDGKTGSFDWNSAELASEPINFHVCSRDFKSHHGTSIYESKPTDVCDEELAMDPKRTRNYGGGILNYAGRI